MAKTVNFTYDYPYLGYDEKKKYGNKWSVSQTTLNGCYTYPMLFNNMVPKCSYLKISGTITNTGSGTVLGLSWGLLAYKQSYGWETLKTFTMPSDGEFTVECTINNYNITQFACVPSSNPGSSRGWTSWFSVEKLTITESITTTDFVTTDFVSGFFLNNYGVEQKPNEVFVDVGGTLTRVRKALANIDGTLSELPMAYSSYMKTTSETMRLYEYIPKETGNYRIKVNIARGDHEARIYSSTFLQLTDGYTYDKTLEFTANTAYYITLTHYYSAEESESNLLVYRV